ncbi:hypothetical protein [Treponema saccharophilum]|uniref:Uncharacterized protein n=1 Tax=Treponema saccharophilum DSM 2985 TaxID=907348 RepID=H7EJL4_9SPIR|nr:hypothetical protein [Treponema saccharophilum]EIC02252.1 hypothetical protein TresaDRAFT_1516 [Treponema saccharophilum DSM 2985]BDC97280.1 hypothetical protein TRSA_23790 [Treponema saccharophilum]
MADQISVVGTVILMMIVDFKQMAVEFKKFFGLSSTQNFPALSIAENTLCQADTNFEFNVIADADWDCKESVQAYYKHRANLHEICIKESVYERARSGDRSALYSIAHEISHWGLINYFKLNLGLQEFERLDTVSKAVFMNIHENIADLLTSLLVFSEEELLKAQSAGDFDFGSCMGKDQISLALFYCQNHKVLAENFMKNIVPKIMAQNKQTELQRRIG